MAHHQNRAFAVAAVCGLAGFLGAFVAWYLLGFVTGVIAMCAWAPEWWVPIYFALAIAVPVVAVWIAIRARRSYLQRHEGVHA